MCTSEEIKWNELVKEIQAFAVRPNPYIGSEGVSYQRGLSHCPGLATNSP